jgi:hypothetical protein
VLELVLVWQEMEPKANLLVLKEPKANQLVWKEPKVNQLVWKEPKANQLVMEQVMLDSELLFTLEHGNLED